MLLNFRFDWFFIIIFRYTSDVVQVLQIVRISDAVAVFVCFFSFHFVVYLSIFSQFRDAHKTNTETRKKNRILA